MPPTPEHARSTTPTSQPPRPTHLSSGAYAGLPEAFFAAVPPTPVARPALTRLNTTLAEELGLSPTWLASEEGVATLSGNRPFENATPIAMAYAGHQFGNFVPSLGDGRAIQIGEAIDRTGRARSIQLKGAGPTPFSRRGDGRAAIGPVLREYVLSEAMAALGIPTTRALAMVTTGEPVHRERREPGAILTRVASDFVRVGTFEYFAARGLTDDVRRLCDYVIARGSDREANPSESPDPYRALLDRVIEGQAELIAQWMLVGFIHGVMNTDNMSIQCETIDYGPCAFLDEYVPDKVFSSIDQTGRYAYDQQPGVGLWNLTRFAETLLPLLADDEDAAIESAKESLERYSEHFRRAYDRGLMKKLGLAEPSDANRQIAFDLLDAMATGRADFTLTFRALSGLRRDDAAADESLRALFDTAEPVDAWLVRWRARLREEGSEDEVRCDRMRKVNPLFIPRNHRVQQAIDALVDSKDTLPFESLLAVTGRPFEENPTLAEYSSPPRPDEVVRQTFCGT